MGCSEKLLDLLFPPRCVLCGQVCASGQLCCDRCLREEPPFCQPLRPGDGTASRPWEMLACAFAYRGQIRGALSRFKFQGDRRAGEYLGRSMAKLVTEVFAPGSFDIVVPVPMPEERLRMRGYNQAEILADYVAAELGIPVLPQALVRRSTFSQHQLTIGFRHREAEHSFCSGSANLAGIRVLLVDDIVTTGSTVAICCRLLLEMGAAKVSVVAAAG